MLTLNEEHFACLLSLLNHWNLQWLRKYWTTTTIFIYTMAFLSVYAHKIFEMKSLSWRLECHTRVSMKCVPLMLLHKSFWNWSKFPKSQNNFLYNKLEKFLKSFFIHWRNYLVLLLLPTQKQYLSGYFAICSWWIRAGAI